MKTRHALPQAHFRLRFVRFRPDRTCFRHLLFITRWARQGSIQCKYNFGHIRYLVILRFWSYRRDALGRYDDYGSRDVTRSGLYRRCVRYGAHDSGPGWACAAECHRDRCRWNDDLTQSYRNQCGGNTYCCLSGPNDGDRPRKQWRSRSRHWSDSRHTRRDRKSLTQPGALPSTPDYKMP